MNIVLVCAAGMSTSLLVSKMQQAAAAAGEEATIAAYPISEIGKYGADADVIMLGPQVRFNLKTVQESFPDKPITVIEMRDYGTMNGEKVFATAKALIKG